MKSSENLVERDYVGLGKGPMAVERPFQRFLKGVLQDVERPFQDCKSFRKASEMAFKGP